MAVEIKWNLPGFIALRTEPAVQALTFSAAQRIAAACNAELGSDGFRAVRSDPARRRGRAAVIAVTMQAREHNARHNTLLRNLSAASRG